MNSKNRLRMTSFIASSFCLVLYGCGSTPVSKPIQLQANEQAAVEQHPDYLRPLFQSLYQEGQRNAVLNRLEIGASAFFNGDIEIARTNFDEALSFIESTFANNENALKARSLWHEERMKII